MKVGDQLPDITATLESGEQVALGRLGKPLVLFFYPEGFLAGLHGEACHFRDLAAEFAKTDAAVYGVAPDSNETLKRFEVEHKVPYASISDPDKKLASAFGASGTFGILKRLTVVADATGKVVLAFSNALNPNAHANKALEALGALGNGKP